MLSVNAKEVLEVLEEVRVHPSTEKYLEDCEDSKHLPVDNILNEHIECDSEEYKALLKRLHLIIHGNLISSKGGNSKTYYKLKNAGYTLRIVESDSWGPLVCGIKVPNSDWWIYYG
jgi:hypothetical protein